ncbi:hypothetical protein MD484_g5344, partial [Candolleomyces efflorescens]
MALGNTSKQGLFRNIRVYWLAFIVYWGIVLFGYDTGIGGGVVSARYFQLTFGMIDADGVKDQKKINNVSGNVVAVLQAGAFFGALSSAPVSSKIGRKWTLFAFSVIFSVGAILTTIASGPPHGLPLIYAGRVLAGYGIGAISAVAPAYVAIGVMISYFVNYAIGAHVPTGVNVWRIPFGLQLVPAGIMALGLLTVQESPRWLASVGKQDEALKNLAHLRRTSTSDPDVLAEMAEIQAAIEEENAARDGLNWKEAFLGKGNFVRFFIAFFIFVLQQWAGQNSVNYYAPQIFASIGYTSRKNSLLASGVYGIVKVVATAIFIFFGVETLGRRLSLFISAIGMGSLFFIIGAILKTHPPPSTDANVAAPAPSPAAQAMAGMLYIYVCFYSMGWDFVVSKVTPQMLTDLGYKIFFMFGAVNIGAMGLFSILIPETKGRSLEEMDVVFGAVTAEARNANIERQKALEQQDVHSIKTDSVDRKEEA